MKGTKGRREFQTAWCVHVSSQGRELRAATLFIRVKLDVCPSKLRKFKGTALERRCTASFARRTGQVRRAFDRVQSGFVEPGVIRATIKVSDNRSPERRFSVTETFDHVLPTCYWVKRVQHREKYLSKRMEFSPLVNNNCLNVLRSSELRFSAKCNYGKSKKKEMELLTRQISIDV